MGLKIIEHGSNEYRQMVQMRYSILREPLGLAVEEGPGHLPRPLVRAGHQFQAARQWHRVHRDPGTRAMTVDVVVRLVLVPRGALLRATLLDQDVVVIEPHRSLR